MLSFQIVLFCLFKSTMAYYYVYGATGYHYPSVCKIEHIKADPILDGDIPDGVGFVNCDFSAEVVKDQWARTEPRFETGPNGRFFYLQVTMLDHTKDLVMKTKFYHDRKDEILIRNHSYVHNNKKWEEELADLHFAYQKVFEEQYMKYNQKIDEKFVSEILVEKENDFDPEVKEMEPTNFNFKDIINDVLKENNSDLLAQNETVNKKSFLSFEDIISETLSNGNEEATNGGLKMKIGKGSEEIEIPEGLQSRLIDFDFDHTLPGGSKNGLKL